MLVVWLLGWQCWSVSRFTTSDTSRAPISAGVAIAVQHCGWRCEQIYIEHTGKSLLKKKATCEVSMLKLFLNFFFHFLYTSPPYLLFSFSTVNLIPTTPIVEERPFQAADGDVGVVLGKSRKRVFPVPHTQEPNPISEAYGYCNTPNRTEQAWEGETCTLTLSNLTKDCKPVDVIRGFELGYIYDLCLNLN